MPTTSVKDQNRSRRITSNPRPGRNVTPQIVFSASCSSPNTDHIPNTSVITAMTVTPAPASRALMIVASMASAPGRPIKDSICSTMCPCAA